MLRICAGRGTCGLGECTTASSAVCAAGCADSYESRARWLSQLRTQNCIFLIARICTKASMAFQLAVCTASCPAGCVILRIRHAARDCHARRGFTRRIGLLCSQSRHKKKRKDERVFLNWRPDKQLGGLSSWHGRWLHSCLQRALICLWRTMRALPRGRR